MVIAYSRLGTVLFIFVFPNAKATGGKKNVLNICFKKNIPEVFFKKKKRLCFLEKLQVYNKIERNVQRLPTPLPPHAELPLPPSQCHSPGWGFLLNHR